MTRTALASAVLAFRSQPSPQGVSNFKDHRSYITLSRILSDYLILGNAAQVFIVVFVGSLEENLLCQTLRERERSSGVFLMKATSTMGLALKG